VASVTTQAAPYVDGRDTLCRSGTVSAMQDLDITPKMATVLKVFLKDPDQPRYGFELMKLTGMASGSLYPMLARLEGAGWLTRGKEVIDPRTVGRPARTHYRITGAAASAAHIQLAELSERFRPPVSGRLRPQGGTA
jgi:PadR family transcriptional regulator PadR